MLRRLKRLRQSEQSRTRRDEEITSVPVPGHLVLYQSTALSMVHQPFFRLPWWVLAALAILLGTLAMEEVSEMAERQQAFVRALAIPPPALIPVTAFDVTRDATAFGEVQFKGYYNTALQAQEWDASGPNMAYVPLFGDHGETVGAVLMVLNIQAKDMTAWLHGQDQAAAQKGPIEVAVGGVVEQTSHRNGILAALKGRGFEILPGAPIIEPFYQGRSRGLESAMGAGTTLGFVLGALAAILGLLAIYKFAWWRGWLQKKARRPVQPKSATPISPAPRIEIAPDRPSIAKVPLVTRKKTVSQDRLPIKTSAPAPDIGKVPAAILRRPFRLRSPEEIVDEVFGPNAGRDTPRRRFWQWICPPWVDLAIECSARPGVKVRKTGAWVPIPLDCGPISDYPVHRHRGLAQLVEHRSPKPRVVGSSPSAPANIKKAFPAYLFTAEWR